MRTHEQAMKRLGRAQAENNHIADTLDAATSIAKVEDKMPRHMVNCPALPKVTNFVGDSISRDIALERSHKEWLAEKDHEDDLRALDEVASESSDTIAGPAQLSLDCSSCVRR